MGWTDYLKKGLNALEWPVKIAAMIPGPHTPFVVPAAMAYGVEDAFRGVQRGSAFDALRGMGSAYGFSKVGVDSPVTGPSSVGDIDMDFLSDAGYSPQEVGSIAGETINTVGNKQTTSGWLEDTIMQNLRRPPYQSNPLIGMDYYQRQAPPQLMPFSDDNRSRPPFFLQPNVRGFAQGGMAGIPRLPDDYTGYVNGPHLVSLGEEETEVVLPLWKLMSQYNGALRRG